MELVGSAILSRVRSLPLMALLIYLAAGLTSALTSDVAVLLAMSAMLFNAAKRLKAPPAAYVSPLAFAVVLGGTMVGTSANIVLLGEYLANTGERIDIFAFTPRRELVDRPPYEHGAELGERAGFCQNLHAHPPLRLASINAVQRSPTVALMTSILRGTATPLTDLWTNNATATRRSAVRR
jgi:hypothetical protein